MSLPKRDGVHDRYYLIHKPDTSPELLAEADLCIQDVLNGTARENHSAYPTVVRNHNGTPFLPNQLLERYLSKLPLKGFPYEEAVTFCDALRRLVGWQEIRYTLEKYIEKQVQERYFETGEKEDDFTPYPPCTVWPELRPEDVDEGLLRFACYVAICHTVYGQSFESLTTEHILGLVSQLRPDMVKELKSIGISSADGIILDLGVSSYQLDTAERGFTYREDAPLDMRMDQRQDMTAKDIVNGYSEMELYRIIRDYGEEKFAKNIAKHIVNARQQKEIETTGELIQIIKAAIPMKVRAVGGHPAKKTFQAIRIELNRELEVLRDSLDSMIDFLNDGGRICVITFHSLEDRIVKNNFRKNENPCICPREFPVCVCGRKSKGFVVTRKPIIPGEEELTYNKRAKSSKLRVFERRREEEES